MKRVSLLATSLLLAVCTYSQELSHVIFSGATTLSYFSFRTDQEIMIRISDNGQVLEWGTDPGPGRYYYDPRKLQPYMGRVEYYGQEYDPVLRGKIKSIGTCTLAYYGSSETDAKAGKLRSIGRTQLDYYANYDDAALKGKLKFAGSVLFDYYSSFENAAFTGKLRSVGNTPLAWYSTFDDAAFKGKIKRIGDVEYIWYPSYDRYQGGLKSGTVSQNIAGITYIIM